MNEQVNYAKIQRIQDNLDALTIGQFGTGFVTDAMLYESGIKATVADHTSQLAEKANKTGVYVRDYGAKGDGVTDDRIAIQNAINYASVNNIQNVIFESGSYLLNSTGGLYDLPSDDGTASPSFISLGDTNITPEPINQIYYCLSIPNNIRLIGIGDVTILGTYTMNTSINKTVGGTGSGGDIINNPIGLLIRPGSPYTDALYTSIYIENIFFSGFFIGILCNGILGGIRGAGRCFSNVRISNCGIAGVIRGADTAFFDKTDISTCYAGLIFGGWWTHRNKTAYTITNMPPYPSLDVTLTGWIDFVKFTDFKIMNILDYNSIAQAIDVFYDTYFFKSINSADTNLGGRRTLHYDNTYSDSYVHTYPGICGRAMSCFNRYGRDIQNIFVENVKTYGLFRDAISIFGRSNSMCIANNFYNERMGLKAINGGYLSDNNMALSDPYIPADNKYYSARGLRGDNINQFNGFNSIGSNLYYERTIYFTPNLSYKQTSGGTPIVIANGYGVATYKNGLVYIQFYLGTSNYTKLGWAGAVNAVYIDNIPFIKSTLSGDANGSIALLNVVTSFFTKSCNARVENNGVLRFYNEATNSYITENDMNNISTASYFYCSGTFLADRAL